MSDLPEAVEEYFRHRQLDPALLDDIPLTKQAFKDLSDEQLDALDMLNKLGKALEKDLQDGKHVKKQPKPKPTDDVAADNAVQTAAEPTDAAPTADSTPDEKVTTYVYAIH